MLAYVPLVFLVATVCGVFYHWLSERRRAEAGHENPQDRRRISQLTEIVAYLGAILVLTGGGLAVGQSWGDITDWGHVGIFASTALLFLAIGLIVLGVAEPAVQRMIGVVWFLSAACLGAAAGLAAHDVYRTSGAATALAAGAVITLYSAILWLIRKLELQMVAMFAGLTVTVSAGIITIAGGNAPWLAFALGTWALGIGWVIIGSQYPQALSTTVPLGTVIALAGPSFAVWNYPWVYAIGMATAGAAIALSVSPRRPLLRAAGILALFGYLTSAVVRSFHASFELPPTLAIGGVVLLALALVLARGRLGTMRRQAAQPGAGEGAEPEPYDTDFTDQEPAEPEEPAERELPHLHLPRAS